MADSWKERIGNLVRDRTKGSIGAIGLRHKSKETFISNLTKRDLEGFTELHCRLREGDPEGHLSFDCWKKGADGISRFAIVDYCLQHGGILPSILIHIEAQLLVSTVHQRQPAAPTDYCCAGVSDGRALAQAYCQR